MSEPSLGDVLRELGKHGAKLDVLTGKVDRLDTVVTKQGEKLDALTDQVQGLDTVVTKQGQKLDAVTNDMEVLGRETRRRFDEFEELFAELPDRVAEAVERTSHARLSAIETEVEALKRRVG
ncbi:MAG: hypothetical protein OXC12_18085 [Spirochaetaceae bacterium]|nr:hypothetical protein [Spirochaetaceae bacterium]